MSGTRIWALALRIVRGFRHDRRSLGLIVVVPLIVMALIGYLVGDSKEPLKVAVSGATQRFVGALTLQPGIAIVREPAVDAAIAAVRHGDVSGAITLVPVDRCLDTCPPKLTVVVPGEDLQIESTIVQAAARASALAQGEPVQQGTLPGLSVERLDLVGGSRPSTISFAAPAMVTTFAFLFTFMLTSVAFLRERSSGTLERLLASPITKAEILTGYLLGFLPFAAVQSGFVLGYAILVLNATVAGPFWLVLVILLLLVVGVVNLGIALSFFARNELQVIQFIPLVLLPQIFLGGLWWPTATLWPPLRWLSILFPITHAVHALRAVMLAGQGFADVWADLLALVLFALAMTALGVLVLRRQRA
ncbi:MAG: ABC transporter permease [Planctomycetaceae bacterium]